MKLLRGIIAGIGLLAIGFACGRTKKPDTAAGWTEERWISWLPHEPALTMRQGEEHMQLGLRDDGVVVWRKGYK